MVSLTITHADSSTDTISETLGWERQRTIGEMRRVRIRVDRADAKAANLEPKTDKIALGSIDTVRLWDIETGGASWTLVCYSFEQDSGRVAPIAGGTLYEGDDQTLITDLINDVPTWTVGSIANLTGALSFVFNHSNRSTALRRIEKNVPGELQWSNEGTVDYVDDLGSDKTATVTISPSQGNLEGPITITERGRILDGTHVRVIGALEGEAQPFANLVPSTDPASYDNRVNYTTSRWSAGDDKDWDVWDANSQDVTDQATLNEEAAALGAELSESLVEAKATIVEGTANLGDWVRVEKPDADLARDMRVHKITTKAGSFNNTDSGAAVVDEVLLSTRTVMRQQGDEDLQDLNRFRSGFQGASVTIQGGGSRQPVDSGVNAEIPFYYPDIVFENEAILHVRGLNYRYYSTPTAHDHDVTIPSHNHSVTIPDHDHQFSVGVNDHVHEPRYDEKTTSDGATFLGVWDDVVIDGTPIPDATGDVAPASETTLSDTTAGGGGTTETTTFDGGSVETTDTTTGVSAGVQSTAQVPTNVDVVIGGNTVASDIGDGAFETTVDISGELTKDAWNMIELTSDSLGHIQATVSIDGYKKVGAK